MASTSPTDEIARMMAIMKQTYTRIDVASLGKEIDKLVKVVCEYKGRSICKFLEVYKCEMQQKRRVRSKEVLFSSNTMVLNELQD